MFNHLQSLHRPTYLPTCLPANITSWKWLRIEPRVPSPSATYLYFPSWLDLLFQRQQSFIPASESTTRRWLRSLAASRPPLELRDLRLALTPSVLPSVPSPISQRLPSGCLWLHYSSFAPTAPLRHSPPLQFRICLFARDLASFRRSLPLIYILLLNGFTCIEDSAASSDLLCPTSTIQPL